MGTEMFHFPTSPPPELYIHPVVTTHNTQRGFPIRTPSDHSSFTNSPRLIADYRVLHRLLMPRHPPCALEHSPPHTNTHKPQKKPTCAVRVTRRITQETQNQTKSQQPHTQCDCQMLASTIQKTNNHHTPQPQPPTGTVIHGSDETTTTHPQRACGPVLPQPNSVPAHTHTPPKSTPSTSTPQQHTSAEVSQCSTHEHPTHPPWMSGLTTTHPTTNHTQCDSQSFWSVCLCCSLERR